MKTKHLYAACLLLITGAAACNSTGTSNSGTGNPGDSTVTTTTTTTYHHKYSGAFTPQAATKYIDLKTNKEITVHIDTVRGSIVNDQTNEPVGLFVSPVTHDTIYGQTGAIVNNYILHDASGDMYADTDKISQIAVPTDSNSAPAADAQVMDAAGKVKYKENKKGTRSKFKDDDVKIKDNNGTEKEKDR